MLQTEARALARKHSSHGRILVATTRALLRGEYNGTDADWVIIDWYVARATNMKTTIFTGECVTHGLCSTACCAMAGLAQVGRVEN